MALPLTLVPNLIAIEVIDFSLNSIGVDPAMGNGYVYQGFVGYLYNEGDFVAYLKRPTQMSISYGTKTYALVQQDDILYTETPLP